MKKQNGAERIKDALRESERRLRQLAEHVPEVLWMVDIKTPRTLYINPAYERIWGRTCESLYRKSRSFIDGIHPEDRQRFLGAFEKQIRSRIPFDIQYRVVRSDGSIRRKPRGLAKIRRAACARGPAQADGAQSARRRQRAEAEFCRSAGAGADGARAPVRASSPMTAARRSHRVSRKTPPHRSRPRAAREASLLDRPSSCLQPTRIA